MARKIRQRQYGVRQHWSLIGHKGDKKAEKIISKEKLLMLDVFYRHHQPGKTQDWSLDVQRLFLVRQKPSKHLLFKKNKEELSDLQ